LRRGSCDEDDGENTEDTFFFVREHQGRAADDSEATEATAASKRGTTLFVANAPIVPGISTKLLLKSIFGRFADVTRVTAVQNPRAAAKAAAAADNDNETPTTTTTTTTTTTLSLSTTSSLLAWSNKQAMFQPTFLPDILSETEGKYAHVVFSSAKEMKKAKKDLEELMSDSAKGRKKRKKGDAQQEMQQQQRALVLDKLELQTLSDESLRLREENIRKALKRDEFEFESDDDADGDIDQSIETRRNSNNSNNNNDDTTSRKHAGVLAVAQRYRESCKFLKSRSNLMEECNLVMQAYEDAEEAKRRAQEAQKAEPDDDGFVTVSYSSNVGSKVEFEQSATATTPSRRKGNKRNRKKKEAVGSGELQDFYRFQRSDTRKRTMEDLRKQFEEDVRKVKRLKEEKEYRPF
jgi:ribosomal RNA-processing protein 7